MRYNDIKYNNLKSDNPIFKYDEETKGFNICFQYGQINNGDDLKSGNKPVYVSPKEYDNEYPCCLVIGDNKMVSTEKQKLFKMIEQSKVDFDILNIKVAGHNGTKNSRFCYTALTDELLKDILETFIDKDNKKIIVFENTTCEGHDWYGDWNGQEKFSTKTIPDILDKLEKKPALFYYGMTQESSATEADSFSKYEKKNGKFVLSGIWVKKDKLIKNVISTIKELKINEKRKQRREKEIKDKKQKLEKRLREKYTKQCYQQDDIKQFITNKNKHLTKGMFLNLFNIYKNNIYKK